MKTVNQYIDPTVFQPIEELRIKFTQNDNIIKEIGEISSKTGYGEAGNVISFTYHTINCHSHPPVTWWLDFLTSTISHLLQTLLSW